MTVISIRRQPSTHLVIAGSTGRVGSALRGQIAALDRSDLSLETFIEANRRVTAIHLGGRSIEQPTDWAVTLDFLRRERRHGTLFVDCTASADVAGLYPELLRIGIGIVTPNKIASSGPLHYYLELRELARTTGLPFLHETTVGAALPLLRPIAELVATGDRVRSMQGVLSGTLSYILSRVNDGAAFSEAVGDAYDRGFTEPDPAIDLSGGDVARKLLILLREAGHAFYSSAVSLESLVPPDVHWDGSIENFVAALQPFDARWRDRAVDAASRGQRLVYAATFDGSAARAGVITARADSPLARLRAGENIAVIHTDRYNAVPLTIAGPGAGPDVTASGVLAEILTAANGGRAWSAGGPRPRPRLSQVAQRLLAGAT